LAHKIILTLLLITAPVSIFATDFVPFVIPDDPSGLSLIADSFQPITTTSSRIEVSGENFVRDSERICMWGVNTSFSGNFPDHSQAERIAKRLSAVGVNCVRLHHMDTSWWPNGLWNPTDGTTIYPAALERLDYFIDQLAQHGIWVNLNLHVGREHSDYLGLADPGTSYDKVAGIFTPALITAQKDFANAVLTHINTYRGVSYADDPAVAFVEITNEDSFFMWNGDESLRSLPAYYSDILQGLYNDWLLAKYTTTVALETAWAEGIEPLGANMLTNGDFANVNGSGVPLNWSIEQHETSTMTVSVAPYSSVSCMNVDITNDDGTGWHLQINQTGLTLEAGRYYTFSFDAASASARSIGVSVMQAHDPWQNLGLSTSASLTTSWQTFELGFFATDDDTNGRAGWSFGGETPTVYLADVQLRPGGQAGLLPGEDLTLGNVSLFVDNAGRPRMSDEFRYLAETEKAYFDDMKSYIKTTLGYDGLVTGTIVFGPLGLYAQSDMDFIDSHAYWRHPWFPGTPWDMNNWFVEQDAMSDRPDEATLFGIAARRLAGKPFTVTEYNHPAPNDYQGECIPMFAAFAAMQDWDGFWMYSYAHSPGIIDQQYFNSFFDIANNPSKMGFMRAGAAIFVDAGVKALSTERIVNLSPGGDVLTDAVDHRISYGNDLWKTVQTEGPVNWQDILSEKLKVSFGALTPATGSNESTFNWTTSSGEGVYSTTGEGAWAFTGRASLFPAGTGGRMTVTSPEFASVSVTALDGLAFGQSQQILITACGRCENTNMIFSPDRRTVGTNWGNAPVLIDAVTGSLELPAGRWTCRALGPDGKESGTANISYHNGKGTLNLQPHFGTMWYLLERATANTANLALGKTVEVSSTEAAGLEGENAVDGDPGTRWSSENSDPQYIIVDLGGPVSFNTVRLQWHEAFADKFLIQSSDDKAVWSTLVDEQSGNGGIDEYALEGNGRYLRIYGTQRATTSGYSLYEIEVYQCVHFNLTEFSTFAYYWLQSNCDLYNQCDGADKDNDNDIDHSDIVYLAELWLSNNCFGL
jgi:hypothetical protein